MKKVLVSFASSDLWRSVRRITKQAEALQVFDEICVYAEKDLDKDFIEHFKDQLKFGSRGYGYWCWKPQVVLQTLDKMSEGDILLYTDVGCHLRTQGKDRLLDYFALAEEHGIVAFQNKPLFDALEESQLRLPDCEWTKGDILDYFGVRGDRSVTHSPTIGAGIFLIKKAPVTQELFKDWLKVYKTDFSLLDDSPSKSPNLPGFIEHRHDQSIWSILCKENHVFTLSAFEYAYPSKGGKGILNWNKIKDYPIWAIRDRDYGFFRNFIHSKYLRSLRWKDLFTLNFYKTIIRSIYSKFFKSINR